MPLLTDLEPVEDLAIDPADLDAIATLIKCIGEAREAPPQIVEGRMRQTICVEPGTLELGRALFDKLSQLGVF